MIYTNEILEELKAQIPKNVELKTSSEPVKNNVQSKEIDLSAWNQTHRGLKFYPQSPYPETIVLEDIAHALSNQCRFTGHASEFYSVAQHCVIVSYLCDQKDRLHGLLHDASEAYIADISSPLKKLPEFQAYRELEQKVQQAIYSKFGLDINEPPSVKQADLVALCVEARTFMSPLHPTWKMPVSFPLFTITAVNQHEAKHMFLTRFKELTTTNGS